MSNHIRLRTEVLAVRLMQRRTSTQVPNAASSRRADMLRLQQSKEARPAKARSEMQLAVGTLTTFVKDVAVLSVLAPHARLCANSGGRQDPSLSPSTVLPRVKVWVG